MTLPRPSSFANAVVLPLLNFAAVALLGLVLAYWTWAWFAPAPAPRAAQVASTGARVEGAYQLFGIVQVSGGSSAQVATSVRLLGVVAASGGRQGYAVVRNDANEILAVRTGKEVAPGVRLAEVHSDHIVLERSGVRQAVALPERGAAVNPAVPAAGK